jgi:hypothetical protein
LLSETIECRDCRNLQDVVVRMKVPIFLPGLAERKRLTLQNMGETATRWRFDAAPSFAAALNRLSVPGAKRYRWMDFKLRCPVSVIHRVRAWKDPGKCPRCGTFMDKHPLPYRIWE